MGGQKTQTSLLPIIYGVYPPRVLPLDFIPTTAFQQLLDNAGVKRVPLPPRSPWLHGYAERWVKSVKDEALSRVILFGESSLRHVLSEYIKHDHAERSHQGLGNVIPFPNNPPANDREGAIECRERLGGLLKYDHRKAA